MQRTRGKLSPHFRKVSQGTYPGGSCLRPAHEPLSPRGHTELATALRREDPSRCEDDPDDDPDRCQHDADNPQDDLSLCLTGTLQHRVALDLVLSQDPRDQGPILPIVPQIVSPRILIARLAVSGNSSATLTECWR